MAFTVGALGVAECKAVREAPRLLHLSHLPHGVATDLMSSDDALIELHAQLMDCGNALFSSLPLLDLASIIPGIPTAGVSLRSCISASPRPECWGAVTTG